MACTVSRAAATGRDLSKRAPPPGRSQNAAVIFWVAIRVIFSSMKGGRRGGEECGRLIIIMFSMTMISYSAELFKFLNFFWSKVKKNTSDASEYALDVVHGRESFDKILLRIFSDV